MVVEEPQLEPADDGDICSSAWYRYINRRGYAAYLTLNRRLDDPPPAVVNGAAWLAHLPAAGTYRVEVYMPDHPAIDWTCPNLVLTEDSSSARYTVHHSGGTTLRVVDQMAVRDGWIDLGEYLFSAGDGVRLALTDATAEAQFTVTVSVSAARFTLVEPAATSQQVWLPIVAE